MTVPPDSMADTKARLRAEAAERREAAHRAEGHDAGDRLAGNFPVDQIFAAGPVVVSGFWPMRSEIDPRPLMILLRDRGCTVALPNTDGPGRSLVFRSWTPRTVLEDGPYGTQVPPASAAVLRPRVLLVPLLAYDSAGWRLGYGGGYYDRALRGLRRDDPSIVAVGVAYQAQRVAEVPHHQGDEPLDWLITERAAVKFGNGQSRKGGGQSRKGGE